MARKKDQKYICVRSAAGRLYRVEEGTEYTEADFKQPGAFLDALRAGFLEPVDAPAPPKPTRTKKKKGSK